MPGDNAKRALPRRVIAAAVAVAVVIAIVVVAWGARSKHEIAAEHTPAAEPTSAAEQVLPTPTVGPCRHKTGVRCGSIRVPLYWSRPEMGSLTVHFRIFEHTDDTTPALEPVVAFEGGPGYGSIGSALSYLFMLGPLHRQHDLIVMDQRGTGSSGAISCPELQRGIGSYVDAVAACARRLGPAANAYGTAAVADDMHAILKGLEIAKVDVYGDSYGTYAAQTLALHHPQDVRSVVLDGAFDQSFNPFEPESSASLREAWSAMCKRAGTCNGILSSIGRYERHLRARPLTGIGFDADGYKYKLRLTAVGFASLVEDATYSYTFFRDLPAALVSVDHGDPAPMLRLAAEDASFNVSGASRDYSVGDYMAVSCHDYPTIWDPSADLATRRSQLNAAIAGLASDTFAPFSNDVWLRSPIEHSLVAGCLKWPKPQIDDPAFPPALAHGNIPVLVVDGEFDQATPVADARAAAAAWPASTYVEVANTAHISILADFNGCATGIFRRFLATLDAGDTSCAAAMPTVNVVPSFPEDASGPPGTRSGDRQIAWAATWTLGDALSRWYNLMYSSRGIGLHGGYFLARGNYYSHDPLLVSFHATTFVSGVSISGPLRWDRVHRRVRAELAIVGPNGSSGNLTIGFPTDRSNGVATITGVLAGHAVNLTLPGPWSPQG